jgi:hypothetical protein
VPVWRFWGAIQIEIFPLHILKSASTNRSCCNWLMSDRLGRLKPMVWWSVRCMARVLNQIRLEVSKEFLKI